VDEPRYSSSDVPTVRFEQEQSVASAGIQQTQNGNGVLLNDSRGDADREPANDRVLAATELEKGKNGPLALVSERRGA